MKLHFLNDEYVTPPGSLRQLLSHPYYGDKKSIEISIFNDHRYAFFFWNKWTQKLINDDTINCPPNLVTPHCPKCSVQRHFGLSNKKEFPTP